MRALSVEAGIPSCDNALGSARKVPLSLWFASSVVTAQERSHAKRNGQSGQCQDGKHPGTEVRCGTAATQVARTNPLRTNKGFLAQRSATIPDNGAPASDTSPQSRPASLGQVANPRL